MHPQASTFLWFESNAAAAAALYCSIVPGATLTASSATSASFELAGQRFIAFNGGPHHRLTPAVSIMLSLDTQPEIDTLWDRFLAAGASPGACGWLTDPFGLSWQLIPSRLPALLSNPRVVAAMRQMQKLDLAALEAAAAP